MQRHFSTMSEKPQKFGLAGNVDLPMRQASGSSALSDDAIPTGDPSDVCTTSSRKPSTVLILLVPDLISVT